MSELSPEASGSLFWRGTWQCGGGDAAHSSQAVLGSDLQRAQVETLNLQLVPTPHSQQGSILLRGGQGEMEVQSLIRGCLGAAS